MGGAGPVSVVDRGVWQDRAWDLPRVGGGLSGPAGCHHVGIRLCIVEVVISWGKVDLRVPM